MLKMSAFSVDTGRQTTPSLIYGVVYNIHYTGCSFNRPRWSQSFQKVLHTTLAPLLVWKFLN